MTARSRMAPEERWQADNEAGQLVLATLANPKRRLPNHAWAFHRRVAQILNDAGLYVECEHGTHRYGDSRFGRIDIFAAHAGGHVFLELDTRKPRLRSMEKLGLVEGFKIIVLRGSAPVTTDGEVTIIGLSVRPATQAERSNRRAWRAHEVAA